MFEQLSQAEFQHLSPEQQQEYMYRMRQAAFGRHRMCPQRSRAQVIVAMTEAPVGIVTPGGQSAGGMAQPVTIDALVPCMEEACEKWDGKKRRCLHRSALIAQAYGKDEAQKQPAPLPQVSDECPPSGDSA